eukprot:304034-Chlamydomonas_euryale.AAC.1
METQTHARVCVSTRAHGTLAGQASRAGRQGRLMKHGNAGGGPSMSMSYVLVSAPGWVSRSAKHAYVLQNQIAGAG